MMKELQRVQIILQINLIIFANRISYLKRKMNILYEKLKKA
jgi:hypothetical protein